jgi:hypothetical protein
MHSTIRKTVPEGMQRSQSTPNVSIRSTEQHKRVPRRTKTTIDIFAASPRHATREEIYVDPFHLAGFFPTSPRLSDQEHSGWWRDGCLEEDSEELGELQAVDGDSSSLGGSQQVLFGREDKPADTILKREDNKRGVLSVGAQSYFVFGRLSGNHGFPGTVIGGWSGRGDDNPVEERLQSPYLCDEACDDEALRLAYETRRRQLWDSRDDGEQPGKISRLFYEGKEEEEAAGWFGLM